MKRAAIETALDNPKGRDSELARVLRDEKAVTLREFARLVGYTWRQTTGALMRGGLETFRDPITGEVVITTKSALNYLTRKTERDELAELSAENAQRSAEAEAYGDGPAAYTVQEYAFMVGQDPSYVRQALHQGRIPGVASREGYLVSGPWARWQEAEHRRRSEKAKAERRAVTAPDDNGWIPVEDAARMLGMKPEVFRVGRRGGLVVRRVPGKGTCVGGPGLQMMLATKKARDAQREAEAKHLEDHAPKREGE